MSKTEGVNQQQHGRYERFFQMHEANLSFLFSVDVLALLQSSGYGLTCAALQMCVGTYFQKCDAGALSFFFLVSRPCLVALSFMSS